MSDDKRPADPQEPLPPVTGKPSSDDGKKAQVDEAGDEGAGKLSVPIEDMTTANDK